MKTPLLLVEDERTLAEILAEALDEKGFDVTVAHDGAAGLAAFRRGRPAVVVSDVMMPVMDGFTFVRQLRREAPDVPVLLLTARGTPEDVVEGFGTGCNDYLRKPFALSELVVRLQALLGRARREERTYPLASLQFDVERRLLQSPAGATVLSQREADVLVRLCRRMGEIVPTHTLLVEVWGDDSFFNARSLHVFMTRLRHHLAADDSLRLENVRGVGYRLRTESPRDEGRA